MKKVLLVDGSALLHRAYHAYPPLKTKQGELVGAVYGVASMLVTSLKEQSPDYVAVAWDLPQPTFRHAMFIGYKAHREKADVEMVEQIPLVKKLIQAMGVKQLEQAGYEADDIIGTLAKIYGDSEREVIILTGDQDLMQLVNQYVKVLLPPRGKVPAKLYGEGEVKEKYGIEVSRFVTYKALIGDPSDNIPGVKGIGPKTAQRLLQRWESLEEIYQHIDEVEERVKQKLLVDRESVELSLELARIECEMELEVELDELEFNGLEKDRLKELLSEWGFRSLMKRIWGVEMKKNKVDSRQIGMF